MARGKREARYGRRAVARLEERVFELETELRQIRQVSLLPPCDLVAIMREVREDFDRSGLKITYKALRVRWDGTHFRRLEGKDLHIQSRLDAYDLRHARDVPGHIRGLERQNLFQLTEAVWASTPMTNHEEEL